MEFTLRHYDRDLFVYQPVGESAGASPECASRSTNADSPSKC